MKNQIIFGFVLLLVLAGCSKDKGSITMTYSKATAQYGNLEELRALPINGDMRAVSNPGKIYIGDNYILIGEELSGIHVYDNTNANNPIQVAFIQVPFNKEFFVKGNFIYAESHYDLLKIDMSNFKVPSLTDRLKNAFGQPSYNDNGDALIGFTFSIQTDEFKMNSPEAKELENQAYLYYNHQNQLIPAAVVPSSFAGGGESEKGTLNRIAVANNHIYVISNTQLYTFQDGATMSMGSDIYVSENLETIYPEGNRVFIGTRSSMIIMSINNPMNPTRLGEYNHPNACDPVYPHGSVAYLTLRTADFDGCSGDENTLDVLDISNPSNPIQTDQITMASPYGMCVVDNKLYVGEGSNGLTIFDITDPKNPQLLQKFTNVNVYDVMRHPLNLNAIVTTGDNGLNQYSIDFTTNTLTQVSSILY